MRRSADRAGIPWTFFLVLLALSLPFWLAGARTKRVIAPGLPVSAAMAVCPGLAALVLSRWQEDVPSARSLLRNAVAYSTVRDARWIAIALTLKPGVMAASYVVLRAASVPVPSPHVTLGRVVGVFAAFFVAAVAEEIGWTVYGTDRMIGSSGVLRTGTVIGIAWASWHLVPLWQASRPPIWIAWHAIETVASRVLIVWMYGSCGRCALLAVLYHTSDNASWLLFPEWGSYYAPQVSGPMTVGAACVALTCRYVRLRRYRMP